MMPKRLPTFRISPANGPNAKAQAAAEWCSAGLQRMALQLERRGVGKATILRWKLEVKTVETYGGFSQLWYPFHHPSHE